VSHVVIPSLRLKTGLGLILCVGLLVGGCAGSASSPSPDAQASSVVVEPSTRPASGGAPIAVLGTENFYADLLSQIGGSRVSATSLLNDPNADPHSFEASPQAAAAVSDARLVIENGLGYDTFMDHLLTASPDSARIVIDVQSALGLPDTANAHVWYDPATMEKVARAAEAALARLEPSNAPYFSARLDAFLASIKALDDRISEIHSKYAGAPVAFTEPVAGYLASGVGLDVLTPEGFMKAIEDGTDPAPADVAAERDLLTGHKVRVLIYNSQVITPLTKQIHDLATQNGVPVVGVAETMPPGFAHFQDWQLAQMTQLEQALAKGA